VERASGSLRAYAVGLTAFMAIKIFAPGFYARQDTRTPVKIGIIAMSTNMVLNIAFYLGGLAHVGLALATSLAAYLNAGLLLRGLRRDGVFQFQSGWGVFLLRLLFANITMGIFLFYFSGDWQDWTEWVMFVKISQLSILVVGGMVVYAASLLLAGLRWRDIHR
jgi:putative peptidoglycan lipid II flippase